MEIVVWGLPAGETNRIHERIIYDHCQNAEQVKAVKVAAAKLGYHSFRTLTIDGSKPDFIGAINTGRGMS
jgi:hypothetical protein